MAKLPCHQWVVVQPAVPRAALAGQSCVRGPGGIVDLQSWVGVESPLESRCPGSLTCRSVGGLCRARQSCTERCRGVWRIVLSPAPCPQPSQHRCSEQGCCAARVAGSGDALSCGEVETHAVSLGLEHIVGLDELNPVSQSLPWAQHGQLLDGQSWEVQIQLALTGPYPLVRWSLGAWHDVRARWAPAGFGGRERSGVAGPSQGGGSQGCI